MATTTRRLAQTALVGAALLVSGLAPTTSVALAEPLTGNDRPGSVVDAPLEAVEAAATTCMGMEPTIVVPPGNTDDVWGTPGRDVILGSEGPDRIFGGAGNDRICGRGGGGDLFGGAAST